jgi:hypothetical protein
MSGLQCHRGELNTLSSANPIDIGAHSDLICTPQLVIAEASATAQIGYARR